MTKVIHPKGCLLVLIFFSFFTFNSSYGQSETLSSGSFIINMGNTNVASINDDVKPYGLIYDLMRNHSVPVKWVIAPGKVKDGTDFTYNGVSYKGGTFIIPAEYRTAAVNAKITTWIGQGVVGITTTSALTVPVYKTLTAVPKWTLDAANGSIAQAYLTAAGITLTAFPGAYNFKAVSSLDCCDDFFVMPHADPTWATHNRLWSWNKDCLGSIWAACHAVSALENSINPANSTQQMNFLSTRTAAVTPTPWPNNSLKLWGTHSGGSIPYTHMLYDDPVAQYMGVTDLSQQNGSEQIYIPKQPADAGGATRWRPGSKIISYDPTQADVAAPDYSNGNVAANIVYGRGMDDPTRGFVMYEAGHSHLKGTSGDGPALRAFLNFSFFQVQPKAPQLTVTGLTSGQIIPGTSTITGLNVNATSPLSGITFTYQWSSTCGGTFSNATGATTNFTAPSVVSNTPCIITCTVTDNCGRTSYSSFPVTIKAANPPTVTPDVATLDPGCGGSASVTKNVLTNDSDPEGDPMTLTQVNGNTGSFTTVNGGQVSFTAAGDITYISAEGYTGTEILTYRVCDNTTPTPLCTNSTYTITVGDANKVPTAVNDAVTIAEDNSTTISVLTNDIQAGGYTGGTISLRRVSVLPTNGRVSVNSDNTVTYIPNADFAGVDVFTYELVNTSGYRRSATVTVTVTNDACDGGTYQTAPPTNGSYSQNPLKDSWLDQRNPTRNNGVNTNLISDGETNRAGRPLLQFDLSSVPAGATITNANLRLVATAAQNNTAFNISLHRVTNAWDEGTFNNANGISNWTQRAAGPITWTTAGGDFNATAEATTSVSTAATYNWTGGTMNTLIQNWVNGTNVNNGMLLKFVTEGTGNEAKTFSSSNNATAANRPLLTFDYSIAGTCGAIPNRSPLANPDYGYTTNSITPLVISNVKANDTDEGALTVTAAALISGSGSVGTITANGFTFTPTSGVTGTAVVEYTVSDGTSTDVARVTITVTGAPIDAIDDAPAGANSGTAQNINVMANDTDPENQKGVLTVMTQPANGTATVNNNGTPANFADDFIVYTPVAGFTGTNTFTYQVCEALPASTCPQTPFCDVATVTVTVLNQVPVAVNDAKTILPCLANTINLTGNDTDPENGALTVTNVSALSIPAAGTLVNNNDGTVTFTPTVGFLGVVTFTYQVTDNGVTPQTSAPATVSITVSSPVNTAPVAVNDAETMNMDETYFTNVRDNDTDPESDPLRLPTITIPPIHGTAIVLGNGLVQYTPNPGYYGTDVLTYQVCDSSKIPATCGTAPPLCATATVSYTILPPPNTTTAYNDEHSTWQDVNVSSNVLLNDKDPQGDALSLGGFFDKDNNIYVTSGTINVYAEDGVTLAGTLTIAANGDFTFDPLPTFSGVVSVPYFINDVTDGSRPVASDSALLKITVNPLPSTANSIIANNDEYTTGINVNVSSTVFTNDADPQANTFTLTGFTFDTDGNGTQDGTGTVGAAIQIGGISTTGVPTNNAGSLTLNADGTFTFNPQDDFTGSIDVIYTICDQGVIPQACRPAVLHIDILPDVNGPANDAPFGGDDFKYTNVNTPVSGNALANDSDPNAGNIIAATPQTTTIPGVGTLVLAADGTYTFTPAPGYTGPAAFPYTICDNQAPALCSQATLHFLVGVDNSTDAINDETSTWQDVNVSGGVLANDFDAEKNTQTFGSFLAQGVTPGAPISSGAVVSGVDKTGTPVANAGTLSFDANGNYTFDPDPAFTGTVTVPYRLCDNGNQSKCDTAYLTITVDPLPTTGTNTVIANNDEAVSYGNPVNNNLFVNDRDPQSDAFTVTSFTGGTVGTPGVVAGTDQYGNPVANAGTLTINANGTYTFTPAPGFVGSINVPYTITDANGATSTAVLHIDVLKDPNGLANDPPFAADDFGYTTINQPVSGSFVSNDSDPNGNPVSYNGTTIVPGGPHTPIGAPVATAQGGTIQFYADGTYTYTPPSGYVGPDRVSYEICDVTAVNPQPLCATAQIHLLVGPGINISGKVWDDANGNVIDPGAAEPETNVGGQLHVNLVDGSGNVVATVPVAPDGTYSFANVTPGANYSLQLTTNAGTPGQPAPATQLPAGWTNTGETRNGIIDGGALGVIDTRNYGYTNTVNFDFGIEQLPNTDAHTTNIPQPVVDQFITLNGGANPPVLSGADPEDCNTGCLLTSKSVIIDAVPVNSELYYNGVLVTNGQLITNFDPSLLQIKITNATLGDVSTSFQYSFVDAAGKKDPTPATYTLQWLIPLPSTGLVLSARLSGTQVQLNWKTETEINTLTFVIERSTDNINFNQIGTVAAAGNSTSTRNYNGMDDISGIVNPAVIYYRIKLVDADNRVKNSNVSVIRVNTLTGVQAWPNPFSSSINVSLKVPQSTKLKIRLIDVMGRVTYSVEQNVSRGITQLPLNGLDNLATGLYILEISDNVAGSVVYTGKFIKE